MLGALLVAVMASGCEGGSCKAVKSAINGLDGGQVRCVRPEDCPLSNNAAVCADTGEPSLPTQQCVRCEETECWLYACSE